MAWRVRFVRRPSAPGPIGLVEPTLLLDREGFDVLRCRRTGLDARSHGPRPHGRSRVTLLVLAVFGARCDRCRCRASDKHRTENENKSGTWQETDHEKARYAWNYRRCHLADCGTLFAAMAAR